VPKALAIPCPCRARRHNWLKSWQKSIGHADFGCTAALELEARSDQARRLRVPPAAALTARLCFARGGDQQGNKQQSQKHSIAETCVWREVLQSVRQRGINDTLLAQAKLFNDSPIRVDHR